MDYDYSIGGGVHLGETAEECVCREVFDETGIHYEIQRLAMFCFCAARSVFSYLILMIVNARTNRGFYYTPNYP